MMENVRQREHLAKTYVPWASPANDNRRTRLAMDRSSFPEGRSRPHFQAISFGHDFRQGRDEGLAASDALRRSSSR
jgi:hypothetical protein